jgi:TRAP-type C4-dicarboxylate transport system substrate-binding protein
MSMTWSSLYAYKLWDVAGYINLFSIDRVVLPIIMNKEAWNSLSPDVQRLVMKLGEEQLTIGVKGLYKRIEMGKKPESKKV